MSLAVSVSGKAQAAVAANISALVADRVASRITAKDFTLWGKDAQAESSIRLGWVTSAKDSQSLVSEILALRAEFASKGVNRFVLCGMGGSSLAPEVITQTAGVELVVLDSTDADQIGHALAGDIGRTAIIVSSKSGSTVETDSQKRVFEKAFTDAGIDKTDRVVVVTDPGSPMEAAAKADGYRVFNADPTVGGRYSALTAFGLVPSGLAGVDIQGLLDEANSVAQLLATDEETNPGLILGAALARTVSAKGYRDKVGIVADGTNIVGFGDWAEQLIAESTGKLGKGILPLALDTQSSEIGLEDVLVARIVADGTAATGDEVAVSGPLGAQFLLWGGIVRDALERWIFFQRPRVSMPQHLRVKFLFVAKMVIDGCNVRARAATDFAHGGIPKADLAKNFGGGFQQLLARRILIGGGFDFGFLAHVSNTRFKQLFDTSIKFLFLAGDNRNR